VWVYSALGAIEKLTAAVTIMAIKILVALLMTMLLFFLKNIMVFEYAKNVEQL